MNQNADEPSIVKHPNNIGLHEPCWVIAREYTRLGTFSCEVCKGEKSITLQTIVPHTHEKTTRVELCPLCRGHGDRVENEHVWVVAGQTKPYHMSMSSYWLEKAERWQIIGSYHGKHPNPIIDDSIIFKDNEAFLTKEEAEAECVKRNALLREGKPSYPEYE